MKKILNEKLSSPQKAFTLIELLIVIAVAGILAAAIITAINPVKRVNQAKDSTIKSDISQISNALQTYITASGTTGSTATYPLALPTLIPSELKSVPKYQGTTDYIYESKNLAGLACDGTPTNACTDVSVEFALNDIPPGTTAVWCWTSSTGVAIQAVTCAP